MTTYNTTVIGRKSSAVRFVRAGLYGSGFVLTSTVAATLTIFLPAFYAEWNPGGRTGYVDLPAVFLFIEPLAVAAAWVGVWAWLRRRWLISTLCLFAAAFGPWGINLELAVIPLALGLLSLFIALGRRLQQAHRSSS
jgi:hypothetical protein